jgi:hypothetical protein
MSKIIANQTSWIGFQSNMANVNAIHVADITSAINLTPLTISITASTQGNTIPTPTLDSLFETSVAGVAQGSFTGDFYRDSNVAADTAWTALPRGAVGYFIVCRFGGSNVAPYAPVANTIVESWPVVITARAAAALTSNQAQTFSVTAAVPSIPNENLTVLA